VVVKVRLQLLQGFCELVDWATSLVQLRISVAELELLDLFIVFGQSFPHQ